MPKNVRRGEKREGENPIPLPFPFPPNPLTLSTAATQAIRIAIKTTPLPTDYTELFSFLA